MRTNWSKRWFHLTGSKIKYYETNKVRVTQTSTRLASLLGWRTCQQAAFPTPAIAPGAVACVWCRRARARRRRARLTSRPCTRCGCRRRRARMSFLSSKSSPTTAPFGVVPSSSPRAPPPPPRIASPAPRPSSTLFPRSHPPPRTQAGHRKAQGCLPTHRRLAHTTRALVETSSPPPPPPPPPPPGVITITS